MLVIAIILACIAITFGLLFLKSLIDQKKIVERYKDIIDTDKYKSDVQKEATKVIFEKDKALEEKNKQLDKLVSDYKQKKQVFDALEERILLYEDELEMVSYGLYKPYYNFDVSDKYKEGLEKVREREKYMVKNDTATFSGTNWTVNGSITEGRKQTKHYTKLMLRAFNGECDALIADVKWSNVQKFEERLNKSYEAINKMGETHSIKINEFYRDLKLQELRLAYELQEKKHQEKEEQRLIQEQMREEAKAQKEMENAIRKAEEQEKIYLKALEQAKKELETAKGSEIEILKQQISSLQEKIKTQDEYIIRTKSMAEQTKVGNIYVISNIGSFGDGIFKIGMTRRLVPQERIDELGSASVPFDFDVHAIIPSNDAPRLENELHKHFENKKVNLIDTRKEFFKASIGEIEEIIKKYNADVIFTKIAEAKEFRQSQIIRENNEKKASNLFAKQKTEEFPETL